MVTKKKEKSEISLKEACDLFGVSRKEFLDKVKEFKIPSLKSGNFSESVLEKYFTHRKQNQLNSIRTL